MTSHAEKMPASLAERRDCESNCVPLVRVTDRVKALEVRHDEHVEMTGETFREIKDAIKDSAQWLRGLLVAVIFTLLGVVFQLLTK